MISSPADFTSRRTFLAADVKQILLGCVQGLKPQTCFYFTEKEQSRETWPGGFYFSSIQQKSSESSGRKSFQVFQPKNSRRLLVFLFFLDS